ncbi:hypothetical protein [Streptomyces sp. NBC_01285]|uniref:hypothetical protein n=1 Tax=Streptomyces sp. NBC_01285 TaxID=2903813 RepID=UPI0022566822|nr:hypothetical protein [Streptomyces sp. NBC_01285]MCX4770169.1 endonuclease domain-containing protein [Streptomyces sp. NBC_01285]
MNTAGITPPPVRPRARQRAAEVRELADLAPDGILFTARAVAAGWTRRQLSHRLRYEQWQPIHRGAWAAPGLGVDWFIRAWVLQNLQPNLVCSHRTAAALHRLELLRGSPVHAAETEFTDPRPGPYRGRPGTRIHRLPLSPADRTVRRGLHVTSPVRTVGDLMRHLPRDEAVVLADSALSARRVGGTRRPALIRLRALHAELASPRNGAARARGLLPLLDPRSGSPAETVARLLIHDAGLHPETQATLRTPDRRCLRPDFFFRAEGLVVEVEGYAFHGTREAHAEDVRRFNDLQGCPEVRRILRFTATEIYRHPKRVVAQIAASLHSLRVSRSWE